MRVDEVVAPSAFAEDERLVVLLAGAFLAVPASLAVPVAFADPAAFFTAGFAALVAVVFSVLDAAVFAFAAPVVFFAAGFSALAAAALAVVFAVLDAAVFAFVPVEALRAPVLRVGGL